MSRIGESSDEQRIREINEAAQRQKVDQEKRADQERVGKAFNQVMAERTKKESAQTQAKKAGGGASGANAKTASEKQGKEKLDLGRGLPSRSQDLAKRAALSQAASGQMATSRSKDSENVRKAESERVDDLTRTADDEKDRVDKDVRAGDEGELRMQEGRAQRETRIDVDPDGGGGAREQRRQERDEGGSGQRDQAPRIDAVDGPRAAHAVKLPLELIEKIASQAALALGPEGLKEMVVSLKGTMLDGITLRVSSKRGKVQCSFEGCDKTTRNLIESSKGDLMRQLSKRGLELEILRVK